MIRVNGYEKLMRCIYDVNKEHDITLYIYFQACAIIVIKNNIYKMAKI